MILRRMLLVLVVGIMASGTVVAKPPTGPLPEGRELDPVTRDFYLAPQWTEPAPRAEKQPARGDNFLDFLCDFILYGLTIPLGTVQMPDQR